MNLHGIVTGYISVVNPTQFYVYRQSTGYVTDANFTQQPQYAPGVTVQCQVQPRSVAGLHAIGGVNLTGVSQKMYLNGDQEGIVRSMVRGGDLFTDPTGAVWLVTNTVENWPDWTGIIVTLQNGA